MGTSCQKGAMKPRSRGYITKRAGEEAGGEEEEEEVKKGSQRIAEVKQKLLPHILHRWHQQLLVISSFLKDVQLWIRSGVRGEKKICTSVGMSASYTESLFKRTLVAREQTMPEMKSYLLQPLQKKWIFLQRSTPTFSGSITVTLTQPGMVCTPVCDISRRVDTKPHGCKRGVESSLARTAASVRLDRHVNAHWCDLHLGQEVTFPTNALPPKAVQKAQMCTNMPLFFFLETGEDATVILRFHQAKRNSSTKSRKSRRE